MKIQLMSLIVLSIIFNTECMFIFQNSKREEILPVTPQYTFKDMREFDRIKDEFTPIISYFENPEQHIQRRTIPEKGWLLTGPKSTDKSVSVECLYGKIKKNMLKRGKTDIPKLFTINASTINTTDIRQVFDHVKKNTPAVVFIDEINSLGLQRHDFNQLLLIDFLTFRENSNIDPSKTIITMAATDKPETLDKALLQPGRFSKEVRFDYPYEHYL